MQTVQQIVMMREQTKESRCEVHNQPWTKIEASSRRLLCDRCLSENEQERRQRLELQRLKLHKNYLIQLNELANSKRQIDRLSDLLQSKNMSEAKKLINKSSPQAQKLVEGLLQRQLKEANGVLRQATEKELQQWKGIDGKVFNSSYLQFEEALPAIEGRLEVLKAKLKQGIASKLKIEMRAFYCTLLEM